MTKALTPLQKFEKKHIPEPNSGCWLWLRFLNACGYGQTRINGRQGKNILAHRWAWQLFRGSIPEGLHVLHHCDNPCCVNPEHLYLGTQADNARDIVRRGRYGGPRKLPKGAAHHRINHKLTDAQALAVREDTRPDGVIATEYQVHPSAINRVKNRKSYVHL